MEEWKAIEGYEGLYEISNLGRVKTMSRLVDRGRGIVPQILKQRILPPRADRNGNVLVTLTRDGKRKTFMVRRLVAAAFIPNPHGFAHTRHRNNLKTDCRAINIAWGTVWQNLDNR
ncbi:hypothetical protein GRI62_11940 [Erythrobacter arachoides]|uniref:NUMOD4 domain-containing protein n=1 Tax=Aurantiacibacter arachoides TaxID=1850444 RepID=A0A845A5U5_9SPHN|nr:NUMOD4 domain-containing protein [Aurantiacibacter arachoides]MXO94307.1 hypothetical protein [Aurantiacibacter arachoides]GGD64482.1 hypothetical protein GCM10011411_26010 [Aurantiacibacter arachoides]